jgi:hypothetical protein
MNSVIDTVRQIVENDEVALGSISKGILNLTAYASIIHAEVENLTRKPVKQGTIVVALSRIIKQIEKLDPIKPHVEIEHLNIKSPLYEVVYEKTSEVLKEIANINKINTSDKDFFVLTQGLTEITIISSEEIVYKVISDVASQPKFKLGNLAGVTLSFSSQYIAEPNLFYTLISTLAVKRINIIEIISTYTEITFILEQENINSAIQAFNIFFKKNNEIN